MSDLLHQQLGVAQSNKQPNPPTIASAANIAPQTRLTFVTGVVAIVNIIPPTTGYCELVLIFTAAVPVAFSVAGNVKTALAPTQNVPVFAAYDPVSNKWWVK